MYCVATLAVCMIISSGLQPRPTKRARAQANPTPERAHTHSAKPTDTLIAKAGKHVQNVKEEMHNKLPTTASAVQGCCCLQTQEAPGVPRLRGHAIPRGEPTSSQPHHGESDTFNLAEEAWRQEMAGKHAGKHARKQSGLSLLLWLESTKPATRRDAMRLVCKLAPSSAWQAVAHTEHTHTLVQQPKAACLSIAAVALQGLCQQLPHSARCSSSGAVSVRAPVAACFELQ